MKKILHTFSSILFALSLAVMIFSFGSAKASAANGANFNAGRIIDDSVFNDKGSMSPGDIQNFLNSKVPTCDTNHPAGPSSQGAQPPWICLKNYVDSSPTGGGRSAAQIIYDEAQQYSINPRVILVTLQKENGLITDTWPYPWQYRTAMGFGCPDGAPCDSQWFGFANQVHQAARHFRGFADNTYPIPPYIKGQNTIKWNPNSACGSSVVNIENGATAALYSYTPYRPNQAALNNLYGTGDGCSAYGNRNFWRDYTDWFGSTQGLNLVRTVNDATIYLTYGTTKYPINSGDIWEVYGQVFGQVGFVSDSYINNYTLGPALSRLVRNSSGTIYLFDSGKKYPFTSCATIQEYGSTCGQSVVIDDGIFNMFSTGQNMTNVVQAPDFTIYQIAGGEKHAVPDMDTYVQTGLSSIPFNQLSARYLSGIPDGQPVLRDKVVLLDNTNGSAYYYVNSLAHPITSFDLYLSWGMQNLPNGRFSPAAIAKTPKGQSLTAYINDASSNTYLVDNNQKRLLPPSFKTQWPVSIVSTIPTSEPSRFTNGQDIKALIKKNTDGTIYLVEGSKKRPIASWGDLINLGYTINDVSTIDSGNVNPIPTGTTKFGKLALIRTASNSTVKLIDNNDSYAVPSVQAVSAYGLSLGSVFFVDQATFDAYPQKGLLNNWINNGGQYYLVDSGKRYAASSQMLSTYQVTTGQTLALSQNIFSSLSNNGNLTQYIRQSNGTIYLVENGTKRAFSSFGAYIANGGNGGNTIQMSDGFIASMPSGQNI